MSTKLVYDGTAQMRSQLADLIRKGTTLLCPRCEAGLIVALDAESVRKHHVHPGVYCSRNPKHFFEMYELRD